MAGANQVARLSALTATGRLTLEILEQVRASVYHSLYGAGESTMSANHDER